MTSRAVGLEDVVRLQSGDWDRLRDGGLTEERRDGRTDRRMKQTQRTTALLLLGFVRVPIRSTPFNKAL